MTRRKTHSPEYALLGFLFEQPTHGYDLHQRLIGELGQVWHVSQSQVYNITKRLGAQGCLSFTRQAQKKLPARQLLRITSVGKRRFEEWLAAPTGCSVHAIRLEFITRLYFAKKMTPENIQSMFDTQAEEINAGLTRLETSRINIPPEQTFNHLSLRLRILQLRSVLEWLMECRNMID